MKIKETRKRAKAQGHVRLRRTLWSCGCLDVPGWDVQMVYDLTTQFEANLQDINKISGIRMVLP